jgi:hypothetical protein
MPACSFRQSRGRGTIPQLLLSSLRHRADHEGRPGSGVPAQGTSTPSAHAHVRRTPDHWTECGRDTSVGNADAMDRLCCCATLPDPSPSPSLDINANDHPPPSTASQPRIARIPRIPIVLVLACLAEATQRRQVLLVLVLGRSVAAVPRCAVSRMIAGGWRAGKPLCNGRAADCKSAI